MHREVWQQKAPSFPKSKGLLLLVLGGKMGLVHTATFASVIKSN